MNDTSEEMKFSKLRSIIWPISRGELKVFLPMAFIMLCVLFSFSALRSIKDSLVVPSIGAEAISFLKLWFVLPCAVIFTLVYIKLSNILHIEYIFYIVVSTFLAVFILFAYVIYPFETYFHPSDATVNDMLQAYPYFQWFIRIFSKWSYAIVYIFGELWSAVVINLMFWQFTNNIITTSQAPRFYPMFGLIGNTGLIFAGQLILYFAHVPIIAEDEVIADLVKSPEASKVLQAVITAISVSSIIAMILFGYMNRVVLRNKMLRTSHNVHETQTKLSLRESISLVIRSKYIGYIVVTIICYGLTINILEGPWKAKISQLYPTTLEYMSFMGSFNVWMGIFSVLFMLMGSNAIRNFSWLISALITPYVIGVTGVIFFIFVVFTEYFESLAIDIGFNPIYPAIIVGAIQNILSKSAKYSLFDSTKEMAYIPLPRELRTKGKAAAEIIGSKVGKSMGAVIQFFIFTFVPLATFDSISSLLMMVFILVIIIWIIDVHKLNAEYTKIMDNV